MIDPKFQSFRKICMSHLIQAYSPDFNSSDDMLQAPVSLPLLSFVQSSATSNSVGSLQLTAMSKLALLASACTIASTSEMEK